MRLFLALRLFFTVLVNSAFAERAARLFTAEDATAGGASQAKPAAGASAAAARPSGTPAAPRRSEAISLLEALQREARFVDLVQEPLDGYSESQIGAAARDVLRDCGKVLERMFALRPVLTEAEGSQVEVPTDEASARYQLLGNVSAQRPLHGRLVHHGWRAAKCELPSWTGDAAAADVIAAAQVEVGGKAGD